MAMMYPEAEVPVSQLSLKRGLDPNEHLAAGRALARLRDAGVLIVGSGLSYHNLRMFGPAAKVPSAQFDHWLHRALLTTGAERATALAQWEVAPAARQAHPREEHLLPLMVAVGPPTTMQPRASITRTTSSAASAYRTSCSAAARNGRVGNPAYRGFPSAAPQFPMALSMSDAQALFAILRQATSPAVAAAIEQHVALAPDSELAGSMFWTCGTLRPR